MKLRHRETKHTGNPNPLARAKRFGAAAGFGLAALVGSPEQFLNFDAPIPLAFTLG